jgi:hypothetical protein
MSLTIHLKKQLFTTACRVGAVDYSQNSCILPSFPAIGPSSILHNDIKVKTDSE